jgi:Flp pilus assembly pilin Flp
MNKFYAFINSFIVSARESESGQTMAEYAVVLSVITIAIIVTLGVLAGGISGTLNSVTAKL